MRYPPVGMYCIHAVDVDDSSLFKTPRLMSLTPNIFVGNFLESGSGVLSGYDSWSCSDTGRINLLNSPLIPYVYKRTTSQKEVLEHHVATSGYVDIKNFDALSKSFAMELSPKRALSAFNFLLTRLNNPSWTGYLEKHQTGEIRSSFLDAVTNRVFDRVLGSWVVASVMDMRGARKKLILSCTEDRKFPLAVAKAPNENLYLMWGNFEEYLQDPSTWDIQELASSGYNAVFHLNYLQERYNAFLTYTNPLDQLATLIKRDSRVVIPFTHAKYPMGEEFGYPQLRQPPKIGKEEFTYGRNVEEVTPIPSNEQQGDLESINVTQQKPVEFITLDIQIPKKSDEEPSSPIPQAELETKLSEKFPVKKSKKLKIPTVLGEK